MNETLEVDGSSIVAGSEAAEMLEATEASLEPITLLVEFGVMRDEDFAIAIGQAERATQGKLDASALYPVVAEAQKTCPGATPIAFRGHILFAHQTVGY